MRNLKRALSLALATVMTMGLMMVGTGASYQDVDDSHNVEAIEVLQTVGIMTGDENGEFNPDANVTRNEMAVIMANLLNLDYDYYRGTNPFTDVPSWAAPYVAACAAEGVTAGAGGNFYNGAGNVTASEAALMIMKALGYFQYQNDFDDGWKVATVRQASYINLFDNINATAETALTRNQIAQLVLNGLKADMVAFTGDVGSQVTIGGNSVNIGYRAEYTSKTSAAAKYNTIVGGKTDIAPQGQYYIQLGEELYNGDLKLRGDVDAFGRPARYWEYDGKEIGTYVNYDLMVKEYSVKVTGKDLYDLLGASTIKDYELTVVIDGVSDKDINSSIFTAADMNKNNKQGVGATGNGVLTQVFVDTENKDITISIINTYLAIANKDYDEKKDELDVIVYGLDKTGDEYIKTKTTAEDKESFTLDGEDFAIADLVEDDALLVTVAEGEVQTAVAPEIVSDVEITAFKLGSNVTVDGTKYEYASAAEYDFEVLDNYTSASNGSNLKDLTYNVYLDKYGYAIGVDLVETPNNYVFITGVDSDYSNLVTKNVDAAAIFLDGTMKTIKVNSTKSTGLGNGATVNSWYTYTVSNDGVYTVKQVAGAIDTDKNVKVAQWSDDTHNTTIDKKHVSLPGAVSGEYSRVYGNDATVYLTASIKEITTNSTPRTDIIIDDIDSVTTGIKNANIQPWDLYGSDLAKAEATLTKDSTTQSAGVYTLYKSNGYIIASVVVGEDAAASKNLVYVSSANVEQEGYDKTADEWTWTRKVISNGQEIELTEVGDSLTYIGNASAGEGKMAQYGWYQVKYNAEGEVIGVEAASTALDRATGIAAGQTGDYVDNIEWLEASINEEDTVLYTEGFTNDQPSMKVNTLFVKTTDKTGFFVAEDVNVALIQYVKNTQETTFETGSDELEKIVTDLNTKNGKYDYVISAILEDGAATSVVIYDKTNSYTKPDGEVDGKDGELTYKATNFNGYGIVDYTITAPEYAHNLATVTYNVNILADGVVIGSTTIANGGVAETFSASAGKTTGRWAGWVYDSDATITAELASISVDLVAIKYVDGDTGATLYMNTGDKSITSTKLTVTNQAVYPAPGANTVTFQVNTDDTGRTLEYTVTGLKTNIDRTLFTGDNNNPQTTASVQAKGDQFVVVTIYGLNSLTEKYDAIGSSIDLKDLANTDAADAGKDLTIKFQSPNSNLQPGANVGYTVELTNNTFNDAGTKAYRVQIAKLGFDDIIDSLDVGTPKSGTVKMGAADLTITKDDVVITPVEALKIVNVVFDGAEAKITFNRDVTLEGTRKDIFSATGTAAGQIKSVAPDITNSSVVIVTLNNGRVFNAGDTLVTRNNATDYIRDDYGYQIAAGATYTVK